MATTDKKPVHWDPEEVKAELLKKYPPKVARKRAKQIAGYPWFTHKKPWQREIQRLLDNGFKLEVEALIKSNRKKPMLEKVNNNMKNVSTGSCRARPPRSRISRV